MCSCYLGTTKQITSKDMYQLLLMNPHDALHHGKRAANKGGCSV